MLPALLPLPALPALTPLVDALPDPVTQWFPMDINPARPGMYELGAVGAANALIALPGLFEFTGLLWLTGPHVPKGWRGLANDPAL